jgi:hypothetical protein
VREDDGLGPSTTEEEAKSQLTISMVRARRSALPARPPTGGHKRRRGGSSPRFARRPLVVSSRCDAGETQEGEMRSGALGFLLREPTAVLFTRKHCTIVGSRSKQLLMIGPRS